MKTMVHNVDLEDHLRNYDFIKFEWKIFETNEDDKYQIVAKSEDLGGAIFGMHHNVYIIKEIESEYYYLKFSADDDNKYLIKLKSRKDLEEEMELYFNRMPTIKGNGLSMVGANMMLEKNLDYSMPFRYKNKLNLFAGLHKSITDIENTTTFNSFIHLTPLRQASAYWNEDTSPMYSIFRTLYSGSQFIFSLFDNIKINIDEDIYHPLVLTINYQKNKNGIQENKYSKYLPIDCLAALNEYKFKIRTKDDMQDFDDDKEFQKLILELLG